jgi:hypothetical protein
VTGAGGNVTGVRYLSSQLGAVISCGIDIPTFEPADRNVSPFRELPKKTHRRWLKTTKGKPTKEMITMATHPRSDERNTAQATQEAAQAAREAARKSSEQAERIGQSAAEMNSQATRTGADILARHVETTQQVLQSGAEMAAKLTQHSAQQFGRSLGLAEDSGQTSQAYARNLSAILQSAAVLAEMTQGITRELVDLGRTHLEQNLDRFERMLHSRGPQDLLAVQSEMVRNNLEGLLGCSRRVAEQSMRTTEDIARRFNDTAEQNRRAA